MSSGMGLEGEVAIVTGATGGIGLAIADQLEERGARVARTGIEDAELHMDVTDRESVEQAVEQVVESFGEPTVLVNNAGVADFFPSEELPEARWHKVVGVNLEGTFRCCQVVGARMLGSGRGSIVNVASILGELGTPNQAAYCASKGGVLALTRALAAEWSGRGVRVNAVCPGYVETKMTEMATMLGIIPRDGLVAHTPLGRPTEPIDVAHAVAFLASPEAGDVTGQSLAIDGGYSIWGAAHPVTEDARPPAPRSRRRGKS